MFGRLGDPLSFLPRVTQHDGRSLEQLLSPQQLGGMPAPVGGAIVNASYVHSEPPLLVRLADSRIPWVVDPCAARFHSPRYLSIRALAGLPYAPEAPLMTRQFGKRHRHMVEQALAFQAKYEPSLYSVPSLPLLQANPSDFRAWQELHEFAASLNGTVVPFRPMLATVYAGSAIVRGRFSVFDRLADRAWAGIYVQPIHFNTKGDSVEKLVGYVRFLEQGLESKFNVIAARPGAFGLVLAALGFEYFDTGLDGGDSYDLTRLDREPREREDGKKGGGHARSVYVRALKAAMPEVVVDELLSTSVLRAQLLCDLGGCRNGGYRYALEHPREHFLHTRIAELEDLRSVPASMRLKTVNDWLESAIAVARLVQRVREEQRQDPIDFGYLERWRSVLARTAVGLVERQA
jgi:hypothetical protein